MGGEETENPGGYTNLLARFNLPKSFTTDISEINEVGTGDLSVELSRGGLTVTNNGGTASNLEIFDLSGRKVKDVRINANDTEFIDLQAGFYIANGVKILVK